jgi:hypothetical protein
LLALLGALHILHVGRVRVNKLILTFKMKYKLTAAAGCDKSVFPA